MHLIALNSLSGRDLSEAYGLIDNSSVYWILLIAVQVFELLFDLDASIPLSKALNRLLET